MSPRFLTLAFLLAACASKPALQPQPPGGADAKGTLTGTVHFVGTPCPAPSGPPCDGVYPGYEVIVYADDGKTVAGKATTAADGSFDLELRPGTYAIFTQAGLMATDRKRTDVVVHRDALATVALVIDTGVR